MNRVTSIFGRSGMFRRSGWQQRRRRKAELALLRASNLFDADWYLSTYADVADAGVEPTAHFLDTGWREGRDPSPLFATTVYLRANGDVARAGINPLIHFIEFGHFEGRASFGSRRADDSTPAVLEDFPAAAEVLQFDLAPRPTLAWRRSGSIDGEAAQLVTVGTVVAGRAPDGEARAAVGMVVSTFDVMVLTGVAIDRPRFAALEPPALHDAWHVNSHLLRARWACRGEPFVVRIFQHDPAGQSVVLVGEGAIQSDLDVIDAHMRQSFFPLLCIFTTLDEVVTGAQMVAFPSLCRGGDHYAEAVERAATAGKGGVDPVAAGELAGERLLASRGGTQSVGHLAVDVARSSGSTILFRSDFRRWLEQVARVGVGAVAGPGLPTAAYLAEAVAVASPGDRIGGTTLGLRHDMIPTLAALGAGGAGEASEAVLPFLVASDDPAVPAVRVEHPHGLPSSLTILGPTGRSSVTQSETMAGGSARAILRARTVSDAELLMPSWHDAEVDEARPAICWLIAVDGATPGQVDDTVRSLRLQDGGSGDQMVLVGTGVATRLGAYDDAGDGVAVAVDVPTAVCAAGTALIGVIAPAVVLHDRRTASILSGVLREPAVASASCAVVHVEEQGSSWQVRIADGGELATADAAAPALRKRAAAQLWGSDYAVERPSPYLWVARSSVARRWLEGHGDDRAEARFHIFSARTACTFEGDAVPNGQSFIAPAGTADVTNVGLLFG